MSNDKNSSVRDKILLTAHDLFYSTGFKATGVDKIIKQAGVTKVTFYRYFPAKSLLILAYLNYRHELWMNWFTTTLSLKLSEGVTSAQALSGTLEEWFGSPLFRGCAFINATAEAESEDIADEIKEICRHHKFQTEQNMASLLGISDKQIAAEIMMLMDGAIIHAQMGMNTADIIKQLKTGLERFNL
ncbi:TetR/AcrR family transcriptional regulator [Leclercia sp.]|uniref:TetR/AcrR family transcriptional regulator n=1 Tax=Leclercia sp. TaxID=1898428 RepID=UPI002FDD8D69